LSESGEKVCPLVGILSCPATEVRYQDKRVALFEKARAPGTRQSVEGQYEGLAFSAPIPKREPLGIRVTEPVVETRPLSVYEAVAGGDDR
jgi:hypothetical protein